MGVSSVITLGGRVAVSPLVVGAVVGVRVCDDGAPDRVGNVVPEVRGRLVDPLSVSAPEQVLEVACPTLVVAVARHHEQWQQHQREHGSMRKMGGGRLTPAASVPFTVSSHDASEKQAQDHGHGQHKDGQSFGFTL